MVLGLTSLIDWFLAFVTVVIIILFGFCFGKESLVSGFNCNPFLATAHKVEVNGRPDQSDSLWNDLLTTAIHFNFIDWKGRPE